MEKGTVRGEIAMEEFFELNDRLGILLPKLDKEWHEYSIKEQQMILAAWENIRGHIPDRIKELEVIINSKQAELDKEENFARSCRLNSEIAEMASIINDLWIWYRLNQSLAEDKVHG